MDYQARLESVCSFCYRGFESHPLRQTRQKLRLENQSWINRFRLLLELYEISSIVIARSPPWADDAAISSIDIDCFGSPIDGESRNDR